MDNLKQIMASRWKWSLFITRSTLSLLKATKPPLDMLDITQNRFSEPRTEGTIPCAVKNIGHEWKGEVDLGKIRSLGILRGARLSPTAVPHVHHVLYDQRVLREQIPEPSRTPGCGIEGCLKAVFLQIDVFLSSRLSKYVAISGKGSVWRTQRLSKSRYFWAQRV